MSRKIMIEFPDIGTRISATLMEKEEPELCDEFWNVLKMPLKMFCYNTLSTGQYFGAIGRPPRHPVPMGSQAKPKGRTPVMCSRLKPGMLMYLGGHEMKFAYGPDITEPVVAPGAVIARVGDEDLDKLMKAGENVWHAQYITHRLVTLTVSRKEG